MKVLVISLIITLGITLSFIVTPTMLQSSSLIFKDLAVIAGAGTLILFVVLKPFSLLFKKR